MFRTLGVDHGTKSLRFCLLENGKQDFFEIERKEQKNVSPLKELKKKGFLDVDLVGLTYSMADGISAITDIKKVHNRGQKEKITGAFVGVGTRLYDEIKESNIKAALIPGLHRDVPCLDESFKILFSHMAASEKTALSYHAFKEVNKSKPIENIVIVDISSNTVSIGIKNSRFYGAIDACLGSPGLLHGPLDLEAIRHIDNENVSANKSFYSAGVTQKSSISSDEILNGETKKDKEARNALITGVKMEVFGLSSLINPEIIVLTGSAIDANVFTEEIESELSKISPIVKLGKFSAAVGTAEIAKDILEGKTDFLGITVDN